MQSLNSITAQLENGSDLTPGFHLEVVAEPYTLIDAFNYAQQASVMIARFIGPMSKQTITDFIDKVNVEVKKCLEARKVCVLISDFTRADLGNFASLTSAIRDTLMSPSGLFALEKQLSLQIIIVPTGNHNPYFQGTATVLGTMARHHILVATDYSEIPQMIADLNSKHKMSLTES